MDGSPDFSQLLLSEYRDHPRPAFEPHATRVPPVLQKAPRGFCDVWVAPFAPEGNPGADLVDELVFLDSILRPLCFLPRFAPPLPGLGDGDEIGTDTAPFNDLFGDSLVGETEMP